MVSYTGDNLNFVISLCKVISMVQKPKNRYLYENVRFLRKKGRSYNDIQRELGTSKSNISLWCRDIELTSRQRDQLGKKYLTAPRLGGLANHKKREKEICEVRKNAIKEIILLDFEAFRIAGIMLYWAEGAKTNSVSISNSDPKMIKFMMRWFEKVFNLQPEQLKASLHIHYGNDELRIKKYWSSLTGIPLKNFGKCFIKPKGTGHRTHILPNGIIRIRVSGTGVENMRHRILAWANQVYELSGQYNNDNRP